MSKIKKEILKIALSQRNKRRQRRPEKTEFAFISAKDHFSSFDKYTRFEDNEDYKKILFKKKYAEKLGIQSPFFISHEGIGSSTTIIKNNSYINFSSYNYLGLNGDPRVSDAAKQAINQFGTSCSASRVVAGERPIHKALELELAKLYDADDALIFVSGHATNVTAIGCLFGKKDLIIHDKLIHDSILQGSYHSGAYRISFKHNDWEALESILMKRRCDFERVLIIIEGMYSMDGDYPDLPKFIELKKKYKTFLMIDEAHSLGVMGLTGRGIGEHFDIDFGDVDIWMGTLSKTLASSGGYIAGSLALIEHLRFAAPGFVYSVGLSPPLAAASLKALEIMQSEPERIQKLLANGKYFLETAKKENFEVGESQGFNIIPIIYKSSKKAVLKSNEMRSNKVNVQPIIYPAVPDNQARLRFFISSEHTKSQINQTIDLLKP